MLNHLAGKAGMPVRAYSAGSTPKGKINPLALQVLAEAGIDASYARSKSWDEFAAPDAPAMHLVITVCDSAASEACPFWPGAPVQVHWGFPDPSSAPGTEADRKTAFEITRQAIAYKLLQLLALPMQTLTEADLKTAVQQIARS